jgi:hypothetical protein
MSRIVTVILIYHCSKRIDRCKNLKSKLQECLCAFLNLLLDLESSVSCALDHR